MGLNVIRNCTARFINSFQELIAECDNVDINVAQDSGQNLIEPIHVYAFNSGNLDKIECYTEDRLQFVFDCNYEVMEAGAVYDWT